MQNWKRLTGIIAVVAIPSSLIGATQGPSTDSVLLAYSSFATLVMNAALVWTITRMEVESVRVKQAYYSGTAALVRFVLVALVLALALIPFLIGAAVYAAGVSGIGVVTGPVEKLLLGLIWLILALPTIFWLCRGIFSIFVIQNSSSAPIRALRQSSLVVKGRTLAVGKRILLLGVLAVIILILPLIILNVSAPNSQNLWAMAGLQLVSSIVLLPLSVIYLHQLYKALQKRV